MAGGHELSLENSWNFPRPKSESRVQVNENLSDAGMLARMAEGDEEAFTDLYRRHSGAVFRFAMHMSADPHLAEDVVQEVFLTLMRKPGVYDPARGALGTFLYGMARNRVLRRVWRRREDTPIPEDAQIAGPGNPGDDYLRSESIERVRRAVLALPPRYREIVVLCDLEEMDYTEVAETVGCPVGTVRSRLHRARRLLVERLGAGRPAGCMR